MFDAGDYPSMSGRVVTFEQDLTLIKERPRVSRDQHVTPLRCRNCDVVLTVSSTELSFCRVPWCGRQLLLRFGNDTLAMKGISSVVTLCFVNLPTVNV